MSSGKTHAKASVALSVPSCVVAATQWGVVPGLGVALGCLAGVFVSPDLDIDHRTYSENALPGMLGTLWYWVWLEYSRIMPHRSFWSHAPIVGTAIRIVYGFWWIALIDVTLFWQLRWLWIGLMISDTAHWVMDVL